jgi:hypothetical protein
MPFQVTYIPGFFFFFGLPLLHKHRVLPDAPSLHRVVRKLTNQTNKSTRYEEEYSGKDYIVELCVRYSAVIFNEVGCLFVLRQGLAV